MRIRALRLNVEFGLTSVFLTAFLFLGVSAGLAPAIVAQEVEPADTSSPSTTEEVDFLRDIQPLFQQRCYSCHGPDGSESGLRMDQKEGAMLGGDRGKIIVASSPQDSRLIDVLTGEDLDVGLMPPDGEGTPFSEAEIDRVRRWIAEGADWPAEEARANRSSHWSFQVFEQPSSPIAEDETWSRSPIDGFVLAKLSEAKIQPSPAASRTTLIRRVYLDLLGLPPSPTQIEEFLSDQQSGAYERMVDRVLASPHFGERWGRHWLDLARYADTDGYEKDRPRPNAWRYRDWVIDALNQDLSFDDFSRWQIAGDMIPNSSPEQRIASGFHRNTLHNTEGGIDPEEDRFKKTIDRTNTFGAIWLGMTVGCAQCHSHKYDPFTQREYYSLFAYFNQLDETNVAGPVALDEIAFEKAKASHQAQLEDMRQQISSVEARRTPTAQIEWEETTLLGSTVWHPVNIERFQSKHGAEFSVKENGQVLVSGPNEKSDYYTVDVVLPIDTVNAVRLEVLTSDQLPKQGPGRADNGNFVLAEFKLAGQIEEATEEFRAIKLSRPQADFSQNGFAVGLAVNGNTTDGWAVSPQMGQPHVASFMLEEAYSSSGKTLRIELDQSYPNNPHNLGSFRISVAHTSGDASLQGIDRALADALRTPRAERDLKTQQLVDEAFNLAIDHELAQLHKRIEQLTKAAPTLEQYQARGVKEREQRRANPMYIRGDFLRPGDTVNPDTPSVLDVINISASQSELTSESVPQDRLELANWLFEEDHPLTSRVTANRVWFRIFGRGLVNSLDDFGLQSDPPSHPELLDWLASELRENDWSIKHLIRQIVLSSTYRQRADYRPELVDLDPNNRLLARQNRRRVEAEIVRDVALTAAGLLDDRIGGPSVRPPQPTEYASLTYADSAQWTTSSGGDAYRRGLYTFFQRTSPYPMLTTFDCPDSNQTATQRNVSNTPIQSLTLWNDPVFFECARALAARVVSASVEQLSLEQSQATSHDFEQRPQTLEERPSSAESPALLRARIEYAYRCCVGRQPSDSEVNVVADLYAKQLALLRESPGTASAIVGEHPLPSNTDSLEFASWVVTARTLINLDEFIMKE